MTGFRARSQSIARTFGLDADEDEEEVQMVEDRARSASVMSLHGAPNQLSLDQFTTASPTPPPL